MTSRLEDGFVLSILGCGNLGTSILSGILTSLSSPDSSKAFAPSSFVACVRSEHSASRIRHAIAPFPAFAGRIQIVQDDNVRGVRSADVVLLGIEPHGWEAIFEQPGLCDALAGKLLISVVAGVTPQQLAEKIHGASAPPPEKRCTVVRVMPNPAVEVGLSMSIFEDPVPPIAPDMDGCVASLFARLGSVQPSPGALTMVASTLSGSNIAFYSLFLEGAVNGGVEMGVDRKEALRIAAYAMKGLGELILSGQDPEEIRRKVATKGGATEQGLNVLEAADVKKPMAEAVKAASLKGMILGRRSE